MESQAMNDSASPPPHPPWTGPVPFTILHHTGAPDAPDHFDLLLAPPNTPGGTLLTWRILPHPGSWPHHPPAATRLPDHRRLYLTYEGPLSDNRGHVCQIATGTATLFSLTPATLTLTLHPLNATLTLPL
jgi:hypothetical protein